jgi:hypothetical protein
VKQGIDVWTTVAGIDKGQLLRSVSKSGKVNRDTLSDWAVWSVVEQYGHDHLAGVSGGIGPWLGEGLESCDKRLFHIPETN